MKSITHLLCLVLIGLLSATTVGAAQWGDLSGTFLYDGPVPVAQPISITKDIAFCGKHKVVNEELVIGSGGGLKNVVLYLYLKRGSDKPAVHESYAKTAKAEVVLDNDKCRFEPHIVLLRTTQTLVVGNKDAVGHNTKIDMFNNPSINPIIPAGSQLKQQFAVPERLPSTVSCSIHPWMTARLIITDNPYFAVTDENGKFEIKNLPVGEWTFQVWQEKSGYVSEVTQDGKATSWRRGRVTVNIKPGSNDLGIIKVKPSLFDK